MQLFEILRAKCGLCVKVIGGCPSSIQISCLVGRVVSFEQLKGIFLEILIV